MRGPDVVRALTQDRRPRKFDSYLRHFRNEVYAMFDPVRLFCEWAHVGTEAFEDAAAGGRPSSLLLAKALERVDENIATVHGIVDVWKGRRIFLVDSGAPEHLPILERSNEPIATWHAPLLGFRVVREVLTHFSGWSHSYLSRIEREQVKMTPAVALMYLAHVRREQLYAERIASELERCRAELETYAHAGGDHASAARREAPHQ